MDDSPLEAELVRRSLASLYQVEVFTDGPGVIEQFANESPPDALVLDRQMPGMSGLEVCRFLRSRAATRALPILMLTVQHDTDDVVQCLAAGADDFLAKPCHPAELSARVSALVRTKQMHERVQAAERTLRSLLMELPDAVLVVDGDQRVTFVNKEGERMFGRGPGDLIGRPLAELLPGLSLEQRLTEGQDTLALPDAVVGDRVFAPALRRYAGINASHLTLSFRDMTSERRNEEDRARLLAAETAARTEAEEASRAKDEFLAVVSHELRTPLNAILGWTRILRKGIHGDEKRDRALETIERNAVSQQKLIEDILDVSRIVSGKVQIDRVVVDLAAIVRAAVDAIRPIAASKSIELRIDVREPLPPVVGDPDRLQQIVGNLLSNAVKFTAAGGTVAVSLGDEAGGAFIRVSDTGKGIVAAFLPYIFDRFRQADTGPSRAHEGLGLGLAIVRHLTELHGGSVEATSELGKGSVFTVHVPGGTLPAGSPEPAVPDSPPLSVPDDALRGLRVLVIDDHFDTRDLLVVMLEGAGAEVRAVSSVREALADLATSRPDAIVSDIGIPNEDGYSFVRRLRELSADEGGGTSAIALTAFAAPRDERRALDAGFDAFLAKPVTAGDLARVLLQVVSRRGGKSSARGR